MDPAELAHRPWPPPRRPWILRMRWAKLLFAHWPVEPGLLAAHLPADLEPDTWEGRGWLGVVPFRMEDTAPRLVPALPVVSRFLELNLRTYATDGVKPGVWFFSLDAASRLAVRAARRCFHLPYFDARMQLTESAGEIVYASERTHRGAPAASFRGRYAPDGAVFRAARDSFEHWLTERYCLYSADRRGRVWRGDIHHAPWPVQPARAEIERNQLVSLPGVELSGPPASLLYADRIDVVAWGLERVATGASR